MPDPTPPTPPNDEDLLSPAALAAAEARGASMLRGGMSLAGLGQDGTAGTTAPAGRAGTTSTAGSHDGAGQPAVVPADGAADAGGPGSAVADGQGGGRGVDRSLPEDGRRRRRWRLAIEWAMVMVVALVVAICVRAFVFETFFIPSGSMLPTLQIGDRIVVDKLSYDLHPVHVGDIVVFRRPPSWPREYADLVKRVIGLPGETLWIHDGNVFVGTRSCGSGAARCTGPTVTAPNSTAAFRQLAEAFLPASDRNVTHAVPRNSPYDLATPYTVPAGDLFVMGDNRTLSADSRFYGPVPRKDLVGEVVFRYWPLSRFGGI